MGCTQAKPSQPKQQLSKKQSQKTTEQNENAPVGLINSQIKSGEESNIRSSNGMKNQGVSGAFNFSPDQSDRKTDKVDGIEIYASPKPEIVSPVRSLFQNFSQEKNNSLYNINEVSEKKEQTESNLPTESNRQSQKLHFSNKSVQEIDRNSRLKFHQQRDDTEYVHEESIQDYGQTTIKELEIEVRF